MSKILIIGAHGKIALLTEPLLVRQGHDVTGVVRNADHATDIEATGARVVVSDIERLDQSGTDALVEGHDVVIWSAGAGGGNPARTKAVDEEAALRVLRAAETSGTRLIMVSYFDARLDHGVPADNPFHAYAEAKAKVDDAIRASGADWVILGPSRLTFDPEGGVEVQILGVGDAVGLISTQVARATVARLIAEVVQRPALSRVTVVCNDGPTPVGEALG